ncbi:butyrophilin 2 [Labeo rohita]|uniref:Butyrophilin 2 n=1 Tax=Labeo rohita TaxID=84645 RepID=A0A498P4M8_LABRO|nr:butyrophilin 2 [Labeo rohita]
MESLMFIFLAVIPVLSYGLIVKGPSGPLVAPLGSSVVLPCSVDQLLSVEGLEVEWKRTDSEALVHLFQDGESQTGVQQEDYQDRAHFFTEEIQRGNFSLRLDDLRSEDEGQYTCTVYIQEDSGETVVGIKDVVSGPKQSISASVGEDVTLSCSVDSHITPEHIDVTWKKTDENIQVLLFQNNKTLPDSAHERYRDRVEFFTDEIPKGNFSLRLKSVRTEDKGVYMCEVFAGGLSANTTVELERLGFSVLHMLVLILCISASGSALLLCCLIYCRYQNGFSVLHMLVLILCISASGSALLLCCLIYCRYQNGFTVTYSQNARVRLGSSVVLNFYSVKPLQMKDLKVKWRRKDKKTLVHLYQDGESRPQQDYQDRAHFITDQIQHGNFSLRLDNVEEEDAGEYTCRVYSQQRCVFSTQFTLEKAQRILAAQQYLNAQRILDAQRDLDAQQHLDATITLQGNCCKEYCTGSNYFMKNFKERGSQHQSSPYEESAYSKANTFGHQPGVKKGTKEATSVQENIKNRLKFCSKYKDWTADWCKAQINTWIQKYSYVSEYAVFSVVVYSALFASAWERFLNYGVFNKVIIMVLFAIVFVCCLCKIIYILVTEVGKKSGRIIDIFDVVADMTFEILPTLQFMLLFYTFGAARGDFHRYVPVYVFGSVVVVLLNSAALITELILKTVNGHRMMADLRFIVFPSECLFAASLLISAFSGSKIADCLKSCQNKVKSIRVKKSQKNESTEMDALNTGDQEQNQPDSVTSQT